METFSSGQKAKEYLIGRIVSEAELQGLSLSETECKMMYFSETAWTLPDISEVNEVFEQDYDQRSYEAKIGSLAKLARDRAKLAKELKTWDEAVRTLKREDHYLLILLHAPTESTDSKLVDALKLLGTAIALIVLLFGIIFAAETMKDHLH